MSEEQTITVEDWTGSKRVLTKGQFAGRWMDEVSQLAALDYLDPEWMNKVHEIRDAIEEKAGQVFDRKVALGS